MGLKKFDEIIREKYCIESIYFIDIKFIPTEINNELTEKNIYNSNRLHYIIVNEEYPIFYKLLFSIRLIPNNGKYYNVVVR